MGDFVNILKFLQLVGKLKHMKRTGWVLRNVSDPESIAGHMYRMSVMTLLIPESENIDKNKCLKMSIVHDLAECIVGDLTPFCGVSSDEKHRQEAEAMEQLLQLLGEQGHEVAALFKEYEEQQSAEAKLVKELDVLDMVIQAGDYEKAGGRVGALEEFFTSTEGKCRHPWVLGVEEALRKGREAEGNSQETKQTSPSE